MTKFSLAGSTFQQDRRRWLAGAALSVMVPASARQEAARPGGPSSACSFELSNAYWRSFVARHLQPDGRVIDFDTPEQHSTSEGQSYCLFFALVNNDRAVFQRALAWTEANLCGGSLSLRLPAWKWGRNAAGAWGVLDPNSASDSDLWIAYSLLEAGRLWSVPNYSQLGRQVMMRVGAEEVTVLDGLGAMLLPWPRSTVKGPVWRLNPSYLPLQLLRRFEAENGAGPWKVIAENTIRMFDAVTSQGYAPDWCAWSTDQQAFIRDPEKGAIGSYDAIRTYLWAGMLPVGEPLRQRLIARLNGPGRALAATSVVPEYVDTLTGATSGMAPIGFYGALLPYLRAVGQEQQIAAILSQLPARSSDNASAHPLPYYERTMILFGLGWLEGLYAFDRAGNLQTHWKLTCSTARPTRRT